MIKSTKKRALLLSLLLIILFFASLTAIFFKMSHFSGSLVADIYKDGQLLQTIRLDRVTESYTIKLTAADGGYNTIEVRPNSIGILAADCPDLHCVQQGFIDTDLLPITCLPHRLVIKLRQAKSLLTIDTWESDIGMSDHSKSDDQQPDMITH